MKAEKKKTKTQITESKTELIPIQVSFYESNTKALHHLLTKKLLDAEDTKCKSAQRHLPCLCSHA